MTNIPQYLREKYGKWGWLGQRAHDAEGINRVMPLDFIISCDYGADIPHYFREQDVFSIEKKEKVRRDWSNEDLDANLKGALGDDIFERWNSHNEKINLLCYRSVKQLEGGNGRKLNKLTIYAMPEKLKKRFDDKVLLRRTLPKLLLPGIPGRTDKLVKSTFADLRRELSLPFVVRFPYGSSGNSTFIIREEEEYIDLQKKHQGSTVIMEEYIEGFSLNVNAVILSHEGGTKTICSSPSVQITGRPECSNFPSSFCGNDFAAAENLDKEITEQVEGHIDIVGKWMAMAGYRGIFGMDFMVHQGTVYALEINPRFQNSTSLYTTLKSEDHPPEETLFLLHIAEFLQGTDRLMKEYVQDFPYKNLMKPLRASQIVLHNRMEKNIATRRLSPGRYRLENNHLAFITECASLSDCSGNDILVTCGVPEPYMLIEANAPICKVQMLKNVLDPADKRSFTPEAKKIIAGVYDKLGLKNADEARMAVE